MPKKFMDEAAVDAMTDEDCAIIDRALGEAGAAPRHFRDIVDSVNASGSKREWREMAQTLALRLDIYLEKGRELDRAVKSIQRLAGALALELDCALALPLCDQRDAKLKSVHDVLADVAAVKHNGLPDVTRFPEN